MKRVLLAGAAFAALTSASFAADMPAYPVEEAFAPVDVWSGFFVGLQAGYTFKDVEVDNIDEDEITVIEADDFVGGLYYGRNWQSGNIVYGIDSSISYMGVDEIGVGLGTPVDVEANLLGLSRLKIGYAMDNTLLFIAGGLASTWIEVTEPLAPESDDSFAFGWTIGAGVEHKFAENWSGRIEYAYFNIEDDDIVLPVAGPIDTEIEGHLVRGGIAYHF